MEIWNDFCREPISNIEGYDEYILNPKDYVIHHRLETHDKWGNKRNPDDYVPTWVLKRLGLYFYRPASELIFMRQDEHTTLHNMGKTYSLEARKRMSDRARGRTPWNKGRVMSDEYCERARQCIQDWMSNHTNEECNTRFRKGVPKSTEHKLKLSEAKKNHKWYTNGEIEVFREECPDGFWNGRIKWRTKDAK